MKGRTDFVTNSSSSSFILSFSNKEKYTSYDGFLERCDYLDYKEFEKLIEHLKNNVGNTDKDDALKLLYDYYYNQYHWSVLDESIHKQDYKHGKEYFAARDKFEKSDEFKEKVKSKIILDPEYLEKKKQIEDANLVIQGMIWDSDGGLLEWAIRNGFIEDNFSWNHVMTWNIG